MLIYGVSEFLLIRKAIKQFLQSMIEHVFGRGGDVPGGCATFLRQFFRATVFSCWFFFNSPMAFLGRFAKICIILAVYYVHFI